jgi:hypothetical protein
LALVDSGTPLLAAKADDAGPAINAPATAITAIALCFPCIFNASSSLSPQRRRLTGQLCVSPVRERQEHLKNVL